MKRIWKVDVILFEPWGLKVELITKTVSQSYKEHLRQPQSFGNDRG